MKVTPKAFFFRYTDVTLLRLGEPPLGGIYFPEFSRLFLSDGRCCFGITARGKFKVSSTSRHRVVDIK